MHAQQKLTTYCLLMTLKRMLQIKRTAEKELLVITKFTNDIGMTFGADKCAYLYIERGQRKTLGDTIHVNGLELTELVENDSYKYLGCNEDISYKGDLNKERVKGNILTVSEKSGNRNCIAGTK